jgi:ankyrin repeat protein
LTLLLQTLSGAETPTNFHTMKKNALVIVLAIMVSFQAAAQADIFKAARTGDVALLKTLYEIKPDTINATNAQGYTPTILACYYNQTAFLAQLIAYRVVLVEKPNTPTALQAAAYKGFKDDVKLLLDYGANPNIADANGTTPLLYAVQFNHPEIVEMLIKKGASVTYKDPNGFSALDYAEKLGFIEILDLLIGK